MSTLSRDAVDLSTKTGLDAHPMSGKATATLSVPNNRASTVGTLTRVEGKSGVAMITIPSDSIPQAQHSFAADVARATIFQGSPELHFAQIDLFDTDAVLRLVRVRYTREFFVERAETNSQFFERLVKRVREAGISWEPESLDEKFRKFRGTAVAPVVIDTDFEYCAHVGDRGAIVFLTTSTPTLSQAIQRGAGSVVYDAPLECTMPLPVLAALLDSWAKIAKELKP